MFCLLGIFFRSRRSRANYAEINGALAEPVFLSKCLLLLHLLNGCKADIATFEFEGHIIACYYDYCKFRTRIPYCTCSGCEGRRTHPGGLLGTRLASETGFEDRVQVVRTNPRGL